MKKKMWLIEVRKKFFLKALKIGLYRDESIGQNLLTEKQKREVLSETMRT